MNEKPCSAASERNRDPILAVLREHFAHCSRVLEIGSGTGQHAVWFGAALPHLAWQTGDLAQNHAGIRAWLDEAQLANVLPPVVVDANAPAWDLGRFDAVFSANTLHIMSWAEVEKTFAHLPEVMTADATLAIYGPFNYGGRFTSPSNEAFDATIKTWGPHMGIRDFEAVDALARGIGLRLVEDRAMPANNRCLVWRRMDQGGGGVGGPGIGLTRPAGETLSPAGDTSRFVRFWQYFAPAFAPIRRQGTWEYPRSPLAAFRGHLS